ncbi:MAG: sigma-70 family RNA polymerase sigma factor [Verrucomicrobiales bacterium]
MKPQPDEINEAMRDFVRDVTEIQPALRAFIGYLMSGTGEVADVTQEVNLLLWEKRDQFEPGTNFRAWAFTCARYCVLGHLRRMRREGRHIFSPELVDQLADEWQDDAKAHEKELVALEYCLERLPSEDLDLVRTRYGSHGGVQRLADRLGQSAGSMRIRLFRLRAALKRCIEKQIDEEGDFA